MSMETGTPADLLARHPETAYFWGRAIGDGDLEEGCLTVRANDETAARRLAAIAGDEQVDHRIVEREYAHDTAITRTEDEYTIQVFGGVAERAAAAFGLPMSGDPGGYRLDAFEGYERQLLRGLLEGCGTVCFKSDAETVGVSASEESGGSTEQGSVGISFVHDDRQLLESVRGLLDRIPPDAPASDIAESSSGSYWFGVSDEAVPEAGPWLYENCEESGLFAPTRRQKLLKSLERAGDR
ncbi:cobalamin biosynthesis protein [Halorussus limi]|uniref:Cobalamin biosynthesis protein n=1 Tax=Halorussus limi TaxID=2938695 RepID=A0A8U0HSN0_9EURY|nr:cobalamin biosynthesis protein [Halorussus limi]UPV73868.1 cobalamin biosynthesis protein [Halorussus limi]